MSLATIIAGIKLLTSLSGQPDTAVVEQKAAMDYANKEQVELVQPVKLNTETGLTLKEVPYQRFATEIDGVLVKYDYSNKSIDDVMSITKPELYKDSTNTVGTSLYKIGNWDGGDQYAFEVWDEIRTPSGIILLDAGRMVSPEKPVDFVIGAYKDDDVLFQGGLLTDGSIFSESEKHIYGVGGLDLGNAYVATGYGDGVHTGFAGIKGLDDFGTFTFAVYDPATGGWSFKSQTGVMNASEGFFSKETFDFAGSYITIPAFHKVHFSPFVEKGDFTLKVAGHGADKAKSLEVMVGAKTPIVNFGVGGDAVTKDGLLELSKQLDILGIKGSVEARYSTNGDFSGYLITNYEL